MMYWNNGSPGWGGWVVMSLMMVLFWGALIFGGIAVWKALSRDDRSAGRTGDAQSTPERLLDERFARGEIDEDDYTHRRELLRAGH